ncbi:MAG: serine acetyltransferase [Myxococcota bacterium]
MRTELVDKIIAQRPAYRFEHVDRQQAERVLHGVLALLFPHYDRSPSRRSGLLAIAARVEADLTELLAAVGFVNSASAEVIDLFFRKLVPISECLRQDAQFIADGDPAAASADEVILAYPGFFAICAHRVAHQLYLLKVPIIPRLIAEYAHERSGCDIHPGAQLGCPAFIDHATGIVIGETARIGNRVKLYQGVTLGALSVAKELSNKQRHPSIDDDVIIYANATVLGGDTHVGARSVIGGNVFLTSSVGPDSVVYHKSEVRIRLWEEFDDGIEFHI